LILFITIILIILSISSEFISTIIYFLVIRKKLSDTGGNLNFGWLPQKRKKQIAKYNELAKKNNSGMFWGQIVIWLHQFSWIFLVASFFLALYIIVF
jgi:hypothetical protein